MTSERGRGECASPTDPCNTAARAAFGEMGKGISPYPYMLIFPQDEHERLLVERLAAEGVEVERRTELLGFEERGARVLARLRRPDGAEEACEADYLAGCDGARSRVREALGIGFPGGTYAHHYAHLAPSYVADTVRARFGTLDLGSLAGSVVELRRNPGT